MSTPKATQNRRKVVGSGKEHLNSAWAREHPEYFLRSIHWDELRLDFALPEVRERNIEIQRELLQKYDCDGLQLEFMRAVPFFDPEQKDKFAHMNTFLTDLKRMMNEVGKEKGKSYRLAIAFFTPTSGRAQRPSLITDPDEAGLDLRTWVQDKLVDVLLPAVWTAYESVPNNDIEKYREMVAGTEINLYAYIALDIGTRNTRGWEVDPTTLRDLACRDNGAFIFNGSPAHVADLTVQAPG